MTPKPLTSETSVATAAVSSSAVDALLRALAADGVCALDPTVPAAVWEKALAGPAAEFLARSGKQLRASFVRAGWALAGSSPTNGSLHASSPYAKEPLFPERLSLIVEVLHAGSLIVDDVQDGSMERRGAPAVHALVGTPLAINLGSWMYFWALAEIAELALPPHIELRLHRVASSTLARCHQGQALDLSVRIADLEMAQIPGVVAATTRLKTAALCRFATELGALAAGASSEQLVAIGRFGEAAGTALQMLDDLGSLTSPARRAKGREDLRATDVSDLRRQRIGEVIRVCIDSLRSRQRALHLREPRPRERAMRDEPCPRPRRATVAEILAALRATSRRRERSQIVEHLQRGACRFAEPA
ncbi:MAG TPA: polyprenyl synthetase family protein, partial [Kofleriaceae bacterium]